jgi:hypothetical protein
MPYFFRSRNCQIEDTLSAHLSLFGVLVSQLASQSAAAHCSVLLLHCVTCARYWVWLGKTLRELVPTLDLDDSFKQHICEAYYRRGTELHMELSRLALFLDPRFKAAACSDAHSFHALAEVVSATLLR